MNDQELVSRLTNIAMRRGYHTYDLPDRGSIRSAANIVMGAKSIDAMSNFSEFSRPWDATFALGKMMSVFDSSPGMISSAMLIKSIDSIAITPYQKRNWMTMCQSLESASIPKLIQEHIELDLNEETSQVSGPLSNIYTLINIQELIHLLHVFAGIHPGEKPDDVYAGVIRRHNRDRLRFQPSHPVIINIHKALLDELIDRNTGF